MAANPRMESGSLPKILVITATGVITIKNNIAKTSGEIILCRRFPKIYQPLFKGVRAIEKKSDKSRKRIEVVKKN